MDLLGCNASVNQGTSLYVIRLIQLLNMSYRVHSKGNMISYKMQNVHKIKPDEGHR